MFACCLRALSPSHTPSLTLCLCLCLCLWPALWQLLWQVLCLLSIQLTRLWGAQAMPSHSITINCSNICLAPKHKCPKAATNRRASQFTRSLHATSIDSPPPPPSHSLFLQLPASGYFKAQPEPNWRHVSRDLLSDSLRSIRCRIE